MAVRFDGNDSYTATTSLGVQAAFSYCLWGKISVDRNAFSTFLDWGVSTSNNMMFQTRTNGTTLECLDDGSTSTGVALTVGTWYFLAAAGSGTTGTMYVRAIDATSWTTATWTGAGTTRTLTTFWVGNSIWENEQLDGCVCGVKAWTVALTQAEI